MGKKTSTNYYNLYRYYGLPLAEAYYLAGYNYFVTHSNDVMKMVIDLLKEICWQKNVTSFTEKECSCLCERYMKEHGYFLYDLSCVFFPSFDFFNNSGKPDDLMIRNTVDYLELYEKKLVTIEEAYVLAKNKNLLLCDDKMPEMIIKIENLLLEKMLRLCDFDPAKKYIQECLNKIPRKQIIGFDLPIGYIINYYMQHYGYTYELASQNAFVPVGVSLW